MDGASVFVFVFSVVFFGFIILLAVKSRRDDRAVAPKPEALSNAGRQTSMDHKPRNVA